MSVIVLLELDVNLSFVVDNHIFLVRDPILISITLSIYEVL
jgi:hypothetical protein